MAATAAYRPGGTDGEPLRFQQLAGCPAGPLPAAPVVARLRARDGAGTLLVLGDLEDIVEVEADGVRPLPALVEPYVIAKGMWAVLPRLGRLYVLVDLNRLVGL